ncbi:CPBP family intramembrane glutamic endopeptidase [Flavobacterium xanthum]|uniref:Soil-associated protein, TIGR03435 family n=1 Tax=Flavobacterium xanthum TaxID=69322 RepID=A0A1M6Z4H4_9FLAO|nr:CPBP family intramembrane glutamic endopeptidase [Flavobacterium xanthum]SHL25408.1 soil-associated protein, TIGR03435 family [Flavobacterium xanthum]
MQEAIKENYFNLMVFLKNPKDEAGPKRTVVQKIKTLLSLLLIEIPVMVVLILLISGLEQLGLVDPENHAMENLIKSVSIPVLLLVVVIIIPFFEELLFRLYLRYKDNYALHFIVAVASLTGKRNQQKATTFLRSVWTKRYKFIFYFSAVLFGMVHITNFEFSYTILLLSPLLVAPQIILGLIIGYLRVRDGFISGFLMHGLHNALFIGIGILSIANHSEKLNFENPAYYIKIEETDDIHLQSTQQNYPDSLAYKNVSLKTILSRLLNTNEILLQTNNENQLEQTLNVYFKNKLKDSSQTKRIALNQIAKTYDFQIKKTRKHMEVWDLKVSNSSLLSKHKSTHNSHGNLVSINPKEIIIKKSNIKSLVEALTKENKRMTFDKTDLKDTYNFTLQTTNFESMSKQLEEKYGLSLIKRRMELEQTTILFLK